MSVQPSVETFFGKRKRLVTDDVYKPKIFKASQTNTNITTSQPLISDFFEAKPAQNEIQKVKRDNIKSTRVTVLQKTKKHKEKPKIQTKIPESINKGQEKQPSLTDESPVKFQLLGSLSPAKKLAQKNKLCKNEYNDLVVATASNNDKNLESKETPNSTKNPSVRNLDFVDNKCKYPTEDIINSAKELVSKIKETQIKLTNEGSIKKELSLKEIKDKINRSSKLSELKKSINKINQHAEELIELEKRKLTGTQPKLSRFPSFEVTVPISPKKISLYSPVKQQKSPCKPAYERFAALTNTTVSLPLPFGYQRLYELFCATDTICSMISNRGEILTFSKLKPAVEEMTRKTFTTRHLGQIATVYPEAYKFHQEKVRNFGSTSKSDKFQLVVTAVVPNNQIGVQGPNSSSKVQEDALRSLNKKVMTPKILKERKEIFYRNLLEKAKDYHEEFLKTLEPPITINRNDLKRWHPNFLVDLVPDVNPQELPQPPDSERPATAKEVLDRAKKFLSSNIRLQNALEAAAAESDKNTRSTTPEVSPEIKAKVDARLKNPLKGVSKSLLEKIRAKQAAKALDNMRMTPEQEKEILTYGRLPDMARTVRTIFVNEQKAVLLLEILLEKVHFSWNRSLDLSEIETHVRLLAKLLPEWLSIDSLKNVDYLKVNRSADVASVMAKLKNIVEEKKAGKNANNL